MWVKLILNWRFLVCFGLAWMITNGWSYALLIVGMSLEIAWMSSIALAYITFIWLPITPEKIITVSIALFLVRVLFKEHNEELRKSILEASDMKDKKKDNQEIEVPCKEENELDNIVMPSDDQDINDSTTRHLTIKSSEVGD